MTSNIEKYQKAILQQDNKINFIESELNQIKLMLEGRTNQYNELKKALKHIKKEVKFAFEDLEKNNLEDLFATLMQISEITNHVYLEY